MAFHIRDTETDRLAREVASLKGVGITEAVKEALKTELHQTEMSNRAFLDQIRAIQTPLKPGSPESGSPEDKALLDELWGEAE